MNLPEANPQGQDPRLKPAANCGKLGPGADVALGGPEPAKAAPKASDKPVRIGPFVAIAIGVMAAVLAGNVRRAGAAWQHFADLVSGRPTSGANSPARSTAPPSSQSLARIDSLKPQKQAETLLELAVADNDGAVEQISSHADRWRGRIAWNPQIANLTTAALNSRDMRVRASGLEVQLAAYGVGKNSAQIEALIGGAGSRDHARKIWALWTLGAMANRGVEADRVVDVLTAHLKDSDEDSRRWAVEALALVGSDSTIPTLLQTMHDDPSPLVRERAACSLAESGMLTREQRFTAVPKLLEYSDDPSLDAQTHAWAFQALGDITGQRLPSDSAAWRSWYGSSR